jgi:hypothetical protein
MSDYQRFVAEAYADATDFRAQAILAQEEADSQRAEQKREQMATTPHRYWVSELIPNFCGRCGCREDHQIHTRKEDK